jgi:hypothetical protein
MRTPQSIEIKGMTYTVAPLGPSATLDLLADLTKMIAPGLAPIFATGRSMNELLNSDTEDLKADFIGEAIKAFAQGIDKTVIKRSIATLADVTTVQVAEDKAPNLGKIYEMHFKSVHGLPELFSWIKFALEVQYGDFFGAVAVMMPQKKTAHQADSSGHPAND